MSIISTEQIRVRFSFFQDGVAFNPASVTVQVRQPSGASTIYGPGVPVMTDGVGSFYYDFAGTELGSVVIVGIGIDGLGNTIVIPEVIEVVPATGMQPRVMTSLELDMCIGPQKVDELFDDDADGKRDSVLVMQCLRRAEDYALSKLLKGWSEDGAVLVMNNDSVLRMHIAWAALEFASERRPAFLAADGKGQFWAQFERAEKYFDEMSKAQRASAGEAIGGGNAQSGGGTALPARTATRGRFVFAPDKNSPFGHGGF